MKKPLIFFAACAILLSANTLGAQKKASGKKNYKLVLRMSHVFAPNEQLTKSLTIVCDNVAKRTNGAIEIQQYPQG